MNCSQCGVAPINKWSNCCYKGGSWYKMCGKQNLFPYTWEQGYYACNINNYERYSIKLIVPGHGDASRTEGLVRNLKKISSSFSKRFLFTCHVFLYNKITFPFDCERTYSKGLWTDFMKQVNYYDYDYYILMMDDVYLQKPTVENMIDTMKNYNLSVAAPSLTSWHWKIMEQNSSCILRKTNYLDMLFTIFKKDAFQCWSNQIDLKNNNYGWGYDITFKKNCNVEMGILDNFLAIHTSGEARGSKRLYNENRAQEQLWNWLYSHGWDKKKLNMDELINTIEGSVTEYIRRPILKIADSSYFQSVKHNGGWGDIMKHLIKSNTISPTVGSISFVDCSESMFMWNSRKLKTPWIGIIHFTQNLPSIFPEKETVQGLLINQNFRESLSFCKMLIVLSQNLKDWLKKQVSIPVVAMKHPAPFVSKKKLNMCTYEVGEKYKRVILLGSQYRRVSTIYNLKTDMERSWLPGTDDIGHITRLFKRDRSISKQIYMNSVNITYTHSSEEYYELLKSSIVIIDLWDAAANNAVLECITCKIPAFITRLPGTVEYIGENYPLLFDNIKDLEKMIYSKNLNSLLISAQNYLSSVKTESIESFSSDISKIGLEVFSGQNVV